MNLIIPENKILELVHTQLNNLFLTYKSDYELLRESLGTTLERCDMNFSASIRKSFNINGVSQFNPYHSGQYCIFLYFLSREIQLHNNENMLADRIYYLNKALNGIDLFYEVELPDLFVIDHPVGSVIGRATYGDYFFFSQNCTVGNNREIYPIIGKNVHMYANSQILGNCNIGNNVLISAGTLIIDRDIPSNSIVFQRDKKLTILGKPVEYFKSKVGIYING